METTKFRCFSYFFVSYSQFFSFFVNTLLVFFLLLQKV
jgi:hypothetical protein